MFKILLQAKLDVSNYSMYGQWKILQSHLVLMCSMRILILVSSEANSHCSTPDVLLDLKLDITINSPRHS